ncbi:serine hydrolase domain-containing protein [Hymenobacter chitinivorans]|uniref:CubicO group peptidase (Beta-lactamase class C family) n=1 Tax=Hymenobacter chitinivorans DSM 11115 TaxID=1121954 RepID=A0A2M9B938_9BACT|nr:serine hydrolase domain-containing protein [Hymenobacter chitinivorans]PJJ54466.1 CubicO group peptidase (beta-lactamase class C family) [Hymenobacter chitinivorans DSM 11115]
MGASLLVAPVAWGRMGGDKTWEREFATFVEAGLARTHTPGLGVAIVRGGRTRFAAGYGLADVQARRAVTPDTAFHIASVSKVVTGAALLRLLEQGKYQLDEPIGPYLDFGVRHPLFPDVPLTFRHLLTHTSGISDARYGATAAFTGAGDPSLPLRDFLTGYLSPGGQWYGAAECYAAARPGTQWSYSNVAIALLGYLAGRVGAVPLDVFTQQQFFRPLRMEHTAWKIAAVGPRHLAKPYKLEGSELQELPPTGYPDWPAGSLRSSPRDFARLLEVFTNEGIVGGHSYLQPATLHTFLAAQPGIEVAPGNPTIQQALIWLRREVNGAQLASHSGGDPGADTVVCLNLAQRTGVLMFANVSGSPELRALQKEVVLRLLDRAATA